MIVKIGKGSNMYGAILYNQQKIDKENGAVLLLNKIPVTVDGRYSVAYFNICQSTTAFQLWDATILYCHYSISRQKNLRESGTVKP